MITFKFTLINEDGEVTEHTLPGMYVICSNCRGKGTHVNKAIDGNGISQEEFNEDPDFFDEYMSGTYDVPCDSRCDNGKVIMPIDEKHMNKEQKGLLKLLEQQEYESFLYNQECEMERKMGA